MIVLCSCLVWGFEHMCPMQIEAFRCIFASNNRKTLIVQPTGHGKSHIMQVLGSCLKGIHLIIHPALLVLTADQAPSFQEGNEDYRVIEMHNLDERASMLACDRPHHNYNFDDLHLRIPAVSCKAREFPQRIARVQPPWNVSVHLHRRRPSILSARQQLPAGDTFTGRRIL